MRYTLKSDAAVLAVGGVLATVYDTDSAEQIRNIVNNADATLLMVETRDMLNSSTRFFLSCSSSGM